MLTNNIIFYLLIYYFNVILKICHILFCVKFKSITEQKIIWGSKINFMILRWTAWSTGLVEGRAENNINDFDNSHNYFELKNQQKKL